MTEDLAGNVELIPIVKGIVISILIIVIGMYTYWMISILGVIIGLRAVLALLIHWEIKTEMKEQELHQMKKEEEKEVKEEK